MKKTIQTIVLAALCLNFPASAQQKNPPPSSKHGQVKGKVISLKTREPLEGAAIQNINTALTLFTDKQGEFLLDLPSGRYRLAVFLENYQTEYLEIRMPLKEPLVIELEPKDNNLNEVQIIGYGETTKRLNTGSISTITAKQIENQPVTNVLSALSGQMPGVFVQTTNGLPGGNINIQIRGKGSIAAGTNPLYIIDGVPYDGSSPNDASSPLPGNYIGGTVSPLNSLNPADIESITVLKDADATSIFGSRGANGVVLISTKKAKAGATQLELNVQQGFSQIAQKPKLLNLEQYLAIRRAGFANDGTVPSADPTSVYYAPDLTLWNQQQGTDWTGYVFGNTAHSTDAQAKVSGGTGNNTFSLSGNYRRENSILKGNNLFERGNLFSQFRHISQGQKWNISLSNQINHQSNTMANPVSSFGSSYLLAPNYPLQLPDGSFNWYAGSNILAELNATSKMKTDNLVTNLNLAYRPLPSLAFKINTGYTKTSYNQCLIFPAIALAPGSINYAQYGTNSFESVLIEPQVDYLLKLRASSISFLAGATYQYRSSQNQFIQASNFSLESVMEDLGSAATIDSRTSAFLPYKYASVFGRVTYNLQESYIFNATLRRDGSSRFGPGNRYGNFGSVGAAWIFSNLALLKANLPFLSYGKLRASYGTTGNDQIGDYQYLSTYSSPGTNIYQDVAAIRPSRINNANFHWETTQKTDLAIELGFLQDRIYFSADYYLNQSNDQLVLYTLPQITGFMSYQANLPAVIKNRGWELSLNTRILDQQKLRWSATFNLTVPTNKLQSFEDFENSSYAEQYQLGYDISRISGYKYLGVDPNTGKAQYAGKDGKASDNPYYNFTLGKLTPDYYGGFGNTFSYGNVEASFFAQFVKQVSRGQGLYTYPGTGISNNYSFIQDRIASPYYPKPSAGAYDVYYPNSSLNIFNTSYLRLKNVSLSYHFPERLLKKLKAQSLKLYAQGQNLLTIWNRNAAVLDPESGVLTDGLSHNSPPVKSFVLGLQLTL
nr:SusC/RagA family TonB-linked outer membrane protein [Pedobacter sp. ASV19]